MGIPGIEKEAYFGSYSASPEKGTYIHSVLQFVEYQIGVCFDVVQEGCSLWFSAVEEPQAELPYT